MKCKDFDSFAKPIDFLNIEGQTTLGTSCGSCLSFSLSGLMTFVLYIYINALLTYADVDVQASNNPRALINDERPVKF